jgi:hypothetical protein
MNRLLGILQTPHRFRTKRQLWTYGGVGIETSSSADHHVVRGQLERKKRQVEIRGLNRNYNHDLKNLFKGAAIVAATKPGPFAEFSAELLARGMRPEMASAAPGEEDCHHHSDRVGREEQGPPLRGGYASLKLSQPTLGSAPRALAEARRQFGVRSDVQARLYGGLYAPREIGLRPARAKLDHKPISSVFSCFAGVAKRHDRLIELIGTWTDCAGTIP